MKKRLCSASLVLALILSLIPIYDIPVKANNAQKVEIVNATTNITNGWAEGAGYGIANVYDGDRDGKQFMSKDYSTPTLTDDAYVDIELSGMFAVSGIDLYTILGGLGCPTEFKILAYVGSQWTEVKTGTASDLEVYTAGKTSVAKYTFEAVECSQLRITTKTLGEHDSKYYIELREIEVYGEPASNAIRKLEIVNAATNIPNAWAEGAGYGIANVYDGDRDGKQFMSAKYSEATLTDDAYVDIELSGAFAVTGIDLYSLLDGLGCPTEFKILAYVGEEWKEVVAGTTSDLKLYTAEKTSVAKYTFEAVECSQLRITTKTLGDGGDGYYFELREVEVYGKPIVDKTQKLEIATATTNITNTWAEGAGYGIANAYDGNRDGNQFMSKAHNAPTLTEDAYVDISLSNLSLVSGMDLYALLDGLGFPTEYKILAYVGEQWKEVATGTTADFETYTAGKTSVAKYTFEEVESSYLRIVTRNLGKHDAQYFFELREVEVFGTPTDLPPNMPPEGNPPSGDGGNPPNIPGDTRINAALNGTVQMNCPDWALRAFGPDRLVDGIKAPNNMATVPGYKDPNTTETITVLFKDGAYAIDQISLVPCVLTDSPRSSFPIDFVVSVWNGSKWVQVAEKTGYQNDGSTLELKFSSVVCNAVRVTATKLGEADKDGEYTMRFSEIEALGNKSSKTLAKPTVTTGGSTTTNTTTSSRIDHSKNIALNCPVKASSDLALYNAGVAHINDGNEKTFFASDNKQYVEGEPQWVEINLLKNYSINKVVLFARNNAWGFPYDFTISVFYDGVWTDVVVKKNFEANETSGLIEMYEFSFPAIVGNKIRLSSSNFRNAGTDTSLCMNEMVVYGTVAKGNYVLPNENVISSTTTITATSSLEDYGYFLSNLIDGDLTTEWSSDAYTEANAEQVLEFDLKNEVQLGEIQIKPSSGGHGFPVDFTISVCQNGKWVEVYSATDYEKPVNEAIQRFTFEPREVSKFKITVTKLASVGGVYACKFNEVMAYPYATGDDFDLDQIAEVDYERTYVAAEVAPSTEVNEGFTLQWWKVISGAVIMLAALSGMIAMLVMLKKKTYENQ